MSGMKAPLAVVRKPSEHFESALNEVSDCVEKAVQDGVFPGCVVLVGCRGSIVYHRAFGSKALKYDDGEEPSPMQADTVFDIASVTNVLVTTTLLMQLVEMGRLRLDDRVSRYIQGFGVYGKSPITVRQVLAHASGLAHWHPYFEELLKVNAAVRRGIMTSRGAKEFVHNSINRAQLKYEPGTRQLYSDLGFMLLGHLIEVLTGLKLDKAAQRYVFQPLGLKATSYIDLTLIRRRGIHPVRDLIAPTEECPWRRRVLCGEVHDDNAWAMGGIAGHSGVFSTAADLHLFAAEMLKASLGRSAFLKQETIRHFWNAGRTSPVEGWRYGWDSPSKENGLSESRLSPGAVGQNGFTGCSIWLEPEQGLDIILLSNRIHPTRSNRKIRAFRPVLIDAVLAAMDQQ